LSLSGLIGQIYDTALDPALWPETLGQAARFIGGSSTALYTHQQNCEASAAAWFFGFDPEFVSSYCETYFRMDPLHCSHFLAPIAKPIATTNIIAQDKFVKTRYYREWARPQGLIDCMNVVLEKSENQVVLFGVSRHVRAGIADDGMLNRMKRIAPHIRRVVLIARRMEQRTDVATALYDCLDLLSAGIFMMDARGHIVHANTAGHRMLVEANCLKTSCGRLMAIDLRADRALQAILAAAADGDAALAHRGILIGLRGRDAARYSAHILPLTSGARRNAGKYCCATSILFVHRVAVNSPSAAEAVATSYSLTPTELRVLTALVDFGGIPDIADALGISKETVKKHLAHLYGKTGTHRQADLVKLIAGYANPLAN
jgi:DNA-binding CsgD family transcriptional regulator